MTYRTYDDWKLASPDDERECDCCGKRRELTQCWYNGIETYACAKCRGVEDEDAYDEQCPRCAKLRVGKAAQWPHCKCY